MFRLVTLLRFNLMPAGSPEDGEEAPGEQRPDAAATLDGERVARAVTRVYARMRYAAAIITLVLGAVYLGAMILWGSVPLKGLIERITTRTPGVVALYVIAFTLVYKLVTLPVGYWRGYVVEHRFGLSNESVGRWLRNEVVGTLLSLVLIVPLMSIVYVLLARSPDTWWIWAAGVWVLFAVVLGKLYPIVILPLFHKQTPVEDEALRDRLSALCAKYEFGVEGVYSFNYSRSTKKANAFLTGFGKTRRVLLADTLLSSFTHDEIETIFAHELGHFVRADLLKSLLWGADRYR